MPGGTTLRYDAVVVGAGPAGSTAARLLAEAGASVLLLDRARFPRDKPCGGGVTMRAARLLPFALDPVVEHVVDRIEIGLLYRRRFERHSSGPLVLMTQRSRLDAFLVDKAVEAGADFRPETKVAEIVVENGRARVCAAALTALCRCVVGADGANGVTARSLGGAPPRTYFVALEGNVRGARNDRYAGRAVLELGVVPGGYAWVFPKGDHVNAGVAGWADEGPRLREHLAALLREHRLDELELDGLHGYRLPLRRPGAALARGPVVLTGDAAGLVDPLSGDGIYEALVSARLAARSVLAALAGERAPSYERETLAALGPISAASWGWKLAFDGFPRAAHAVARTPTAWRIIVDLLRGDLVEPRAVRGARRAALWALDVLGRAAGDPAAPYWRELAAVPAAVPVRGRQ